MSTMSTDDAVVDPLRLLGEIFQQPLVAQQIRSAPETWIWGLLNSILASVPATHMKLIPKAMVAVVTMLFAVFDPEYLATVVKGPEFYATPANNIKTNYDYIIVGGGTAGCLLANRLSASYSVLMIEAGSTTNILNHVPMLNIINMQEPSFGLDWLYFSVEQKYSFRRVRNKKAHMGAGRGIGGSSHLNFQFYSRGSDEDYDRWETVYGAKGWNAKEMLHYMKKHERVFEEPLLSSDRHGKDGELSVTLSPLGEKRIPIMNAWMDAAAKVTSTKVIDDHNAGGINGFGNIQTTVDPSGRISNSAAAFIDPIRMERQENLHILLDTMVDKILLDDSMVARGVQTRSCTLKVCSEETREFTADKEVILSAGTARDPQILMLSGIGPREELEKHSIPVKVELPGVGRNLHDHVVPFGQGVVFPSRDRGKGWHDWELNQLYNFFTNRTGFFMSPAGALSIGFVHSPISKDKKRPDLELIALDVSPAAPVGAGSWEKFGMLREDYLSYVIGEKPETNQDGFIITPILMRSKSRGKVHLASTNVSDYPILDFQYLSDPHDVQVLVEALRYSIKIAKALSNIGGAPLQNRLAGCTGELDSNEYLECFVRSFTMSPWHMSGTCRFGASNDPLTVVDSELRVRGVKNLRIVDASVFPEELTGHLAASVYGVAEKGAHLILQTASGKEDDKDL